MFLIVAVAFNGAGTLCWYAKDQDIHSLKKIHALNKWIFRWNDFFLESQARKSSFFPLLHVLVKVKVIFLWNFKFTWFFFFILQTKDDIWGFVVWKNSKSAKLRSIFTINYITASTHTNKLLQSYVLELVKYIWF